MSPRRGLWAKPAPARIGPLREDAQDLPAWPFVVAYSAYFLWWVLGSGDLMWPLFATVMLVFMIGRHGLRFPPGTILWVFFLAWVLASMTMLDTGGRVIGAFYRFLLELSPGVFAVYAFNARKSLSVRTIVGTMWGFLASTTIGGFIAMAAPTLRFKTLMYYLVPRALHSNDFVKEFTKRATTQWNPSSWILSDPRPSAPFIYSNTYGNVYSLIFPLALIFAYVLWRERNKWRVVVAAVCALSVIPAAATLNRGMYIGLIVIVVWVGFQRLRAGAWRTVLGIVAAIVVGVGAWLATPASQSLLERVAASSSTEDRASNYLETLYELQQSPLLGFGAPRPSASPWLPSLGTQGQFWTVIFSYGLVGLALFLAFFLRMVPRIWRATDVYGSILGGIILATLVEQFYYGMNTGLMISVVAVALLSRHLEEENDPIKRAQAEREGVASTGGVAGTVRAERAVRMGQWTSPAANDGAFATAMLARLNKSGRRGTRSRTASTRRRPSQTENR